MIKLRKADFHLSRWLSPAVVFPTGLFAHSNVTTKRLHFFNGQQKAETSAVIKRFIEWILSTARCRLKALGLAGHLMAIVLVSVR